MGYLPHERKGAWSKFNWLRQLDTTVNNNTAWSACHTRRWFVCSPCFMHLPHLSLAHTLTEQTPANSLTYWFLRARLSRMYSSWTNTHPSSVRFLGGNFINSIKLNQIFTYSLSRVVFVQIYMDAYIQMRLNSGRPTLCRSTFVIEG